MIWTVIAAVVVLYVVILVIMYFLQPGMVYFPSRAMELTPANIGLDFEEVDLKSSDGVNIHGWFVPADSGRATLLFCHGNGGNISNRLESIQQFHQLGLSVFIFDYHGYGRSGGKPGEKETYLDAEAAWEYLTAARNIDPGSIIIFGRSLGGAVATWLAVQYQSGAIIIESSFSSLPDIAARHYPFLPVKWLARFRYNSAENMAKIHAPVLIIHSPDDDLIPYDHGRKLFDLAGEPKEFLEISGGHNDGFLVSDIPYRQGIDAFVSKYFSR